MLPMSNSSLDHDFSPTHIFTSPMIKLEHLDETYWDATKVNKHNVMEHNIMGLTTLQSQEFLYGKHGFLVP
jgi:hypothetical protein